MTSLAPLVQGRVDRYLARFDSGLSGIPSVDRDDVLLEIRAHIMDSLDASDDEAGVQRVLAALGEPEQLAKRYRTEFLLARAGRSFSPWTLLRTSWHWAKLGAKGMLVFLLGLVGYGSGLALMVTVLLKPFMPSRVGLWVHDGLFTFGIPESSAVSVPGGSGAYRELLGNLYVPVVTVMAFAILLATNQALRWIMRRRTPRPVY